MLTTVLGLALSLLLWMDRPVTQAATYYVAPEGTDQASCADARHPETPRQTPDAAVRCLDSGDTLIFAAGTYTRGALLSDQPQVTTALPVGRSASQPTTLRAAEGATVILRPEDREYPGGGGVVTLVSPGPRHLVFEGLIFDGNVIAADSAVWRGGVLVGGRVAPVQHGKCVVQKEGATHVTYRRVVLRNCGEGFQGGGDSLFEDVEVHSNGLCITHKPQASEDQHLLQYYMQCFPPEHLNLLTGHGMYITSSNNRVLRPVIHHNGGYGIQVYGGASRNNNVIRDGYIYSNNQTARRGAVALAGSGNQLVNMVIHNEPTGIVLYTTSPTLIAHNTLYRIGRRQAPHPERPAMYLRDATRATRVERNLILDTPYPFLGKGGAAPATDLSTNVIAMDPRAVVQDAPALDLRLREGSPAIGTRPPLPEVRTDMRGSERQHDDAGALAYLVVPPPVEPPSEPPVAPPAPVRLTWPLGPALQLRLDGTMPPAVREWLEQQGGTRETRP